MARNPDTWQGGTMQAKHSPEAKRQMMVLMQAGTSWQEACVGYLVYLF
jgi:hypothetical protein